MDSNLDTIYEAALSQVEDVPYISSDTNFWMIRSKRGVFFDQYIYDKFIAIGWNVLSSDTLSSDDESLKKKLKDSGYINKQPGTTINKCRRFLHEIKTGDIAIIVGKNNIAFAIIGEYFEISNADTSLEREIEITDQIDTGNYKGAPCPYQKRRHIEVIDVVSMEHITPIMYKCLAANRHSLSNLNDYAESIIGACYDFVRFGNTVLINFHVCQPKKISPADFYLFTYEVTSLLAYDNKQISTKCNVNSEGDCLFILENITTLENLVPILLIYFSVHLSLFGGKIMGTTINPSIDFIRQILSYFIHKKENEKLRSLSLEKQELENRKLKAEIESIELANEEQKRKMYEQSLEKATELQCNLQRVSQNLKIRKPSDNTLKIFSNLLK